MTRKRNWGPGLVVSAESVTGMAVLLLSLVPSNSWLDALRSSSDPASAKLMAGATLFRVSLAALGAFLIVGRYRGFWETDSGTRGVTNESGYGARLALVLLAAGAALRLYGLNRGLWVDEVTTLVEYVRPSLGDIVTTYGSQNQHFLFSVLAHLSITAFGESVWSLRLPAALFGIATLWALWRLGLELTSPREALLSMALLTFSYPHIWFSQNARGYSALLFWTIASSYYLVRGLRERSRRLWAAYAVAVALGMYTHLTMAFVVAGQFAAYVWDAARRRHESWEDRLAPFFGGFLLAGLLTIVCYAIVLPQMPDSAAADLSNVAEWRSLGWLLREFGRGVNAGPLVGLAVVAGLTGVGSGCVSYLRESPVLPILFIVPVVSGGATMIALGHHLWPRFFLFAAGFAILIAVRGATVVATAFGRWLALPRERSTKLATVGTVLIAAAMARSIPYVYRPKQDYEGAKRFVEADRQPGDAVASAGVAALAFRAYYAPEWRTVSTLAELDAIRAASARTWLLYTLPIEMANTYPEIYESARKDFHVIRTFDGSLGDGAIYVLRADRTATANARNGVAIMETR